MASAMVNNNPGVAPEPLFPFAWLAAPTRLSFGRDGDIKARPSAGPSPAKPSPLAPTHAKAVQPLPGPDEPEESTPGKDLVFDFEFRRLDDPVAMLPADELFSDGKLVPLHLSTSRPHAADSSPAPQVKAAVLPGPVKQQVRAADQVSRPCLDEYYAFSPKAPRCSTRWKELLGLKRAAAAAAAAATAKPDPPQKISSRSKSPNPGGLKHFLHRSTKSASNDDSSYLSLPLPRDSDNSDSAGLSSARLSLSSSSSSSGPDHNDLPRLSLDSDKRRIPSRLRVSGLDPRRPLTDHAPARPGRSVVRLAPDALIPPPRGASVDSPRMNSYGKIVFQSLGRSSSSPSTFNGGPRAKQRAGMERSYSGNVRVTPVLNVPFCSLRGSSSKSGGSVFGFGQLFSPHKKEPAAAATTTARSGSGCVKGERGASRSWVI